MKSSKPWHEFSTHARRLRHSERSEESQPPSPKGVKKRGRNQSRSAQALNRGGGVEGRAAGVSGRRSVAGRRRLFRLSRRSVDAGGLTGGEPLLRHGVEKLVAQIAVIPGITDLAITTTYKG